jgi:hypothetical protein
MPNLWVGVKLTVRRGTYLRDFGALRFCGEQKDFRGGFFAWQAT